MSEWNLQRVSQYSHELWDCMNCIKPREFEIRRKKKYFKAIWESLCELGSNQCLKHHYPKKKKVLKHLYIKLEQKWNFFFPPTEQK
jgi:hypothetical protein